MPGSSGGHRDTQRCRGRRIAAFLANYREDFHIGSPTVLHAFRYRCGRPQCRPGPSSTMWVSNSSSYRLPRPLHSSLTYFGGVTYWASPLPNDQFSFGTSTKLMKTSSLGIFTPSWRRSASVL